MLRVGLTGGIAAGKSTAARRLAERGAVVIDADSLARAVVAPGSPGLAEVVATFGEGVLGPDGSLDRTALGRLVFADAAARTRLEAITHPRIAELTAARIAAAPSDAVVVHDVPLLVEKAMGDRYHLVVVVDADPVVRLERLTAERGLSEADARARVRAQATEEARRAAADVWLDSSGTPEALFAQVDRLWTERLVPFEANVRHREPAERDPATGLTGPDPRWADTGARLADRARRAAGPAALAVDHVGSTAVPGLVAKDVIDLQLVVGDLATADGIAASLADAGFPALPGEWADTPKPAGAPPWPKRLHASADPARPVNLHVRAADSPGARFALLFRDWLRAEEAARDEYGRLKRELAATHRLRDGYAAAKEPWFTEVAWPATSEWAAATGWAWPRAAAGAGDSAGVGTPAGGTS